jgi:hypothetical protein
VIAVPVPAIEKPLTAIDYIAVMDKCSTFEELRDYATRCPVKIVEDDRFARAFKNRLDEIRGKRASA